MVDLNAYSFWDTDLTNIEATFLPKGKKITDLPVMLDSRVPSQGSVNLGNTINIDNEIKENNFLENLFFLMKNRTFKVK